MVSWHWPNSASAGDWAGENIIGMGEVCWWVYWARKGMNGLYQVGHILTAYHIPVTSPYLLTDPFGIVPAI